MRTEEPAGTQLTVADPDRRWRRLFRRKGRRFGLDCLLLGVLVACGALGIVGSILHQTRKQRHAVANLEKAGVVLTTDAYGWVRKADLGHYPTLARSKEPPPSRRAELKFLEGLPKLQELSLSQTAVTNDALKLVGNLSGLQSLDLMSTKITDEGLKHISHLQLLTTLDLTQTDITDRGLSHLANLTRLKVLVLDAGVRMAKGKTTRRPRITDAGLKHLAQLRQLEELHLYGSRVGDPGLAHLKNLTALKKLNLGHVTSGFEAVRFEEAGTINWKPLSEFPPGTTFPPERVAVLEQVTDAGVRQLATLTELEYLSLQQTRVTDDCLSLLGTFAKLRELDLRGTRVSADGAAKLQSVLPECKIRH